MSVQMATGGVESRAASSMPADCAMRAHADASQPQMPAGGTSCTSCELCIPLADLNDADLDLPGFAVHAMPLMGGADFISASPVPALEPPIS